MNSSYATKCISFDDIFKVLTWTLKPRRIVEFGILEGFSLMTFAKEAPHSTEIKAYDIFEKFNGNSAKRNINKCFEKFPNVSVNEGDFYTIFSTFDNESIDILHIDIANDGNVYEFAIQYYMPKISKHGVMILEGGSEERDKIDWMTKYGKKSICDVITNLSKSYDIQTISAFPSLTLIRRL